MAIGPTTQARGVRKPRGASGARRRMISIQTATAVKATSEPALARATISSSGRNRAMAPTIATVNRVMRIGFPPGDTFDRPCGSRPSRAMTKKMRLWP
ncbi:hypothetical protein D3C86_1392450 [compost metagenome]